MDVRNKDVVCSIKSDYSHFSKVFSVSKVYVYPNDLVIYDTMQDTSSIWVSKMWSFENTFSYTDFTGEFASEVRKTKFWWKSTFLGGT